MSEPDLLEPRPRGPLARAAHRGRPRPGPARPGGTAGGGTAQGGAARDVTARGGAAPGGTCWPGTARAWAVDVAIALAATALQVGGQHAIVSWGHHAHQQAAPTIWAHVLLAVGGIALVARRRYPVGVLAVALATAVWAAALGARLAWFALIVAFLNAVVARKREAAVASLAIGYVASVWPPWLIGQAGHSSVARSLGLAAGLMFLLSVGELIRIRSQRAAALARSREDELARRSSEERMRMARDLHDVVAHNISAINVQANTALHLMDRQPERARAALATINDVSRQALVELRSVLGVLRDVDAGAPRAPASGLSRLRDLADTAAAAGLAVRVVEDGQPVPLPADVDLTAYRIVQEALTNSARHSGGSNATVRLRYGDGELCVEVADDGGARAGPAGGTSGTGNGIAGMRERAAALGGTLTAGPGTQGGFAVRARLPLPGPQGRSGAER